MFYNKILVHTAVKSDGESSNMDSHVLRFISLKHKKTTIHFLPSPITMFQLDISQLYMHFSWLQNPRMRLVNFGTNHRQL